MIPTPRIVVVEHLRALAPPTDADLHEAPADRAVLAPGGPFSANGLGGRFSLHFFHIPTHDASPNLGAAARAAE